VKRGDYFGQFQTAIGKVAGKRRRVGGPSTKKQRWNFRKIKELPSHKSTSREVEHLKRGVRRAQGEARGTSGQKKARQFKELSRSGVQETVAEAIAGPDERAEGEKPDVSREQKQSDGQRTKKWYGSNALQRKSWGRDSSP